MKDLEFELETLQNSERDVARKKQIMEELRVQQAIMESIRTQKSLKLWLKESDKNTKFFHLSTLIRQRRNRIEQVSDGEWQIQNEGEIAEYFTTKFQELFTSGFPTFIAKLSETFPSCIIDTENIEFNRIPNEKEIKDCVWELHPLKSPSSYGFPGIFFRRYWLTVKERLINFVQ